MDVRKRARASIFTVVCLTNAGSEPVVVRGCLRSRSAPSGGKTQRGEGGFHYNPGNPTNHPAVRTTPNCVVCGTELEPPVRTPHTVYVKTLYRIGGQDYCRHHVIRVAVAAGLITEVRPGAGAASTTNRGACPVEHDRSLQG